MAKENVFSCRESGEGERFVKRRVMSPKGGRLMAALRIMTLPVCDAAAERSDTEKMSALRYACLPYSTSALLN